MNYARLNFQTAMAAMLAAFVAFSPAFAEPDDAEAATAESAPSADAALSLDASSLSAAFDASGVSSYKCRSALKDFEKAVADANAVAVAQRAKVAEVARKYLTDSLDKARTAGDLDKVLVFQKALETVDGEIAGDAEAIVKLRNGRAAQLDKIDKGLVASGLTAAKALDAHLELQKKEITQKGEIETALKVAAFQKQVEEWTKKTKDAASAHSSATTGGPRSRAAASEVRRPPAPMRQPVRETRPKEPEAKIVTIDARSENGTSIGKVQEGDTIEIQYVGGKWHDGGRRRVAESPDDAGGFGCVLAGVGKLKLANIPTGTKDNPYQYAVDESDAGELFLIMGDSIHSHRDNTGSVRYSVRIIPAGGHVSPRAAAAVDSRPPASTATPSSASGRFSNQALTGTQTETSVTLAKTLAPHVIRDQYFVPEGKELIVEAGATIIFEKDASLYCEGTLKIQGMETAPVVFKGKMSKKGYWKGVEIKGGASSVEFASISDAQIGVLVNGKNTMVKCCRLMNSESGVALRWDGRPSIVDNCTLYNNTVGIRWENSHGSSVRNCSFLNNDDCGLILWNPWPAGGIAAINCLFSNNRLDGIRGTTHCAKEASIKNCSFSKNGRFDVDIGPFPKLDCRQNYWGPSVTRLLQQRGVDTNLPNIKDGRDSGRDNIVDVAEFLTEPPKDCGATIKW